jgi:hypothetical protein
MSDEGREDTSVLDGTCWLGRLIRRGGQMEVDFARHGVCVCVLGGRVLDETKNGFQRICERGW